MNRFFWAFGRVSLIGVIVLSVFLIITVPLYVLYLYVPGYGFRTVAILLYIAFIICIANEYYSDRNPYAKKD